METKTIDNYDIEMAKYIWTIIKTQPIIAMSWGIEIETIRPVKAGLQFKVNGFKHQGLLRIQLNEGEDLFEVHLIDENDKEVNVIKSIYIDNLISTIDDAVEKTENYAERISEEYEIL